MKIITITFNDQGISWGPAIHYLELWNSFQNLSSDVSCIGYAPSWTKNKPIKKALFDLRLISVPNIKVLRPIFYDIIVGFKIIKHRKDAIYYRTSSFHLFSLMMIKLLSIKPIIELNGLLKEDHDSTGTNKFVKSILHWQEHQLLKSAYNIICVSEGIRQSIISRGIEADKTTTITNGVSEDFFKISPSKVSLTQLKTVIYVGTFTPWDGACLLPKLADRNPHINFLIVGDGELRPQIEKVSPTNMKYVGYQPYVELDKFYSQADAGIVLYEIERHKNVQVSSLKTMEYLASGLPIFSTRINGQEFIEEDGIGHLAVEDTLYDDFKEFEKRYVEYKIKLLNSRDNYIDKMSWKRCAVSTLNIINSFFKKENK